MNRKTSGSKISNNKKNTKASHKIINEDLSYLKKDKILEKVEKYVNKNREETSQRIIERKENRPILQHQEANLEMMISKIRNESHPKKDAKEISKWILNILYIIVIAIIIIFSIKYFLLWNAPQIS